MKLRKVLSTLLILVLFTLALPVRGETIINSSIDVYNFYDPSSISK